MEEQTALIDLDLPPSDFAPATHVCHLFSDEVDRRSVIHPFVRAGLQRDEDVYYFADALVTELLERAIDERSVTFLTREQVSRLTSRASRNLLPDRSLLPESVIERLEQLYKESRDDGASGCRATGEMGWALRGVPGPDRLVEYESEINALVRTDAHRPCSVSTTRSCSMERRSSACCRCTRCMIIRGQIMHNPCYVEPDEFEGDTPVADLSQETVLARLYFVQLALASLPDDKRIAEFMHCAFLQVPGVEDVHFCLADAVFPPDGRFDGSRQAVRTCGDQARFVRRERRGRRDRRSGLRAAHDLAPLRRGADRRQRRVRLFSVSLRAREHREHRRD